MSHRQYVSRALHGYRLEVIARITRIGKHSRNMEDNIAVISHTRKGFFVQYVARSHIYSQQAHCTQVAARAHQHPNLMAVAQQRSDQIAAHQASCASNQRFHCFGSPASAGLPVPTVDLAAVALVPGVIAVLAGAWQYTSLPAETGPRLTWWLLPVFAGIAALCGLVPFVRRDRVIAPALLAVAGFLLVGWSWMRLDGLTAAIVPTDAPNWFDRGATVGVLVAGFGIVILALWELIAATRRPDMREQN